jgi:NitT/TauT family transport system substrate-binding protein
MAFVDCCRLRRSVLAPIAALVLSAAAATAAEIPVKLVLDGKIDGPSAPFFVAIDRGYYKAEGLDVTIAPATDAAGPFARLTDGTFELARADLNALIKLRDAKPAMPVKAVFIVYDKPAYAVIARKSRGITQPKDLEGKKLGAPTADPASAQWPIFARTAGIEAAKVTVEPIGLPVREPMLAAGQVDAITGISFASYIDLKDRGVPTDDLKVMLMADYGVQLYGTAIMVSTKFAAEKPEAVKAFLRAYVRALRESVRDPARAIESILRRNDAVKKEVELERLRMAIRENILTPAVKVNGFGDIDPPRLGEAIDQIGWTYHFKAKDKAADAFDSSFLPPSAARKAH